MLTDQSNLDFSTANLSCYRVDDTYPKVLSEIKKNNLKFKVLPVKVSGYICRRHRRRITGWTSDNGKTYHDDGYCERMDRCFSEEGYLDEKRLIVLSPEIIEPKTFKDWVKICQKEMPNPSGFNWPPVNQTN